jgi:hypothetical protein
VTPLSRQDAQALMGLRVPDQWCTFAVQPLADVIGDPLKMWQTPVIHAMAPLMRRADIRALQACATVGVIEGKLGK